MSKITISVVVINHTNEDMILSGEHLEHGVWLERPTSIPDGRDGDFAAGNGRCNRIEGYVRWNTERTHNDFSISFDKPVHGTTRFSVDCSDRYRYTISGDPLEEHAHVSVSFFRQDLDEPVVHARED